MPYTKEQLQNGKSVFYNSIREDLRNNYLDVLSGSAENDFRDSDGVLDVNEGDVVTNDDPFDTTRFLIEDRLKRRFRNLGEFYGRGFTLSNLKTITQQQLDTIVDGEDL